jgi:hypothetical protein
MAATFADPIMAMAMEEPARPRRGASAIRMLAAALAGGFGAFGFAATAHPAPTTAPPTTAATAAAPHASDVKPD